MSIVDPQQQTQHADEEVRMEPEGTHLGGVANEEGEEMVLQESDLQNRSILQDAPTGVVVVGGTSNDESLRAVAVVTPTSDEQREQQQVALELALQQKEKGNLDFQKQEYLSAAVAYRRGLKTMEDAFSTTTATTSDTPPTKMTKECNALLLSLHANLAQAFLKLDNPVHAIQHCTAAIEGIDPAAPKVWYRRAAARDMLAQFILEERPPKNYNTTAEEPKDIWIQALNDLSECQRLWAAMNQKPDPAALKAAKNIQQKLQDLAAMELQPELSGESPERSSLRPTSNGSSPAVVVMNGQHASQNGSTGSQIALMQDPIQGRPDPAQQRKDVMKLLMNRSDSLLRKNDKAYPAEVGEALFLMEWKWWCQWCRHVDFFRLNDQDAQPQQQQQLQTPQQVQASKRMRESILELLPPGAMLPPIKKPKTSHQTDDDSSTDSEDDYADVPPLPVDNTALFLLPPKRSLTNGMVATASKVSTTQPKFYQQWYRHLWASSPDDTVTMSTINNNANDPRLGCLKPNLVRGFHYEILPREVYYALCTWYGEVTPRICRRTSLVPQMNGAQHRPIVAIDLYPLSTSTTSSSKGAASSTSKQQQQCSACRARHATRQCTRCKAASYCGRPCQESHWTYHKSICSKIASKIANGNGTNAEIDLAFLNTDGRVGLNNVGNTCFMNSALQCLSHATPLTRHFLSNLYKVDLNPSNPLGTGGKLADAFDAVLKELWLKPNIRNTSPTALKRAIAQFAPRFAGCLQHDSQEFLAYLLDGLHEDLNRIRKAPYVEMPDADEHGDTAVAAAEAWECHLRRNDSLVMDTFYGQFKSTCVCPNPQCGRVSVSFDAYNHVSLEIPQVQRTTTWMTVYFLAEPRKNSSARTVRYAFCLPRGGLISDLRNMLSQATGIPITLLMLCEISDFQIACILDDRKPLGNMRSDEYIFAYQTAPHTPSQVVIVANHSHADTRAAQEVVDEEEKENPVNSIAFGIPFLTACDASFTCRQLWDHMWKRVRRNVLPLTESGDEEDLEAEMEEVYKTLVRFRVFDREGHPRQIFPAKIKKTAKQEEQGGEVAAQLQLSSYIPRDYDEAIFRFLGEDCTNEYLFITMEWLESVDVPPEIVKNAASGNAAAGSTNNKKKKKTKKAKAKTIPTSVGIQLNRFVDFLDDPSTAEMQKQQDESGNRGVSLDQCFQTFTKPERLDEQNAWYCSNCKQHVRALKTMELWRLPNVLIVHLKRFAFRHAYRREKLATHVEFPLEGLDMSKYCAMAKAEAAIQNGAGPEQLRINDSIPAEYDLFGVVNHYGRMGFGHYTAYARKWDEAELSNEWELFDDSNVARVADSREIVSSAAYVLFYRRRNFS